MQLARRLPRRAQHLFHVLDHVALAGELFLEGHLQGLTLVHRRVDALAHREGAHEAVEIIALTAHDVDLRVLQRGAQHAGLFLGDELLRLDVLERLESLLRAEHQHVAVSAIAQHVGDGEQRIDMAGGATAGEEVRGHFATLPRST